jgi:hypothetical protein
MLKLAHFHLVNQVACTRDVLIEKLRHVEAGDFVVTIGGREREDDETKRVVKPVPRQLLQARIRSLNADLGGFGVDVVD